ncbi:hypothetical protein EDD86DRAFT_207097 [Gorgonomyces haynaldii]|nr:hypothetical protein EDD86DRAFT_207097 [Gorgonomyces haynaldii]
MLAKVLRGYIENTTVRRNLIVFYCLELILEGAQIAYLFVDDLAFYGFLILQNYLLLCLGLVMELGFLSRLISITTLTPYFVQKVRFGLIAFYIITNLSIWATFVFDIIGESTGKVFFAKRWAWFQAYYSLSNMIYPAGMLMYETVKSVFVISSLRRYIAERSQKGRSAEVESLSNLKRLQMIVLMLLILDWIILVLSMPIHFVYTMWAGFMNNVGAVLLNVHFTTIGIIIKIITSILIKKKIPVQNVKAKTVSVVPSEDPPTVLTPTVTS